MNRKVISVLSALVACGSLASCGDEAPMAAETTLLAEASGTCPFPMETEPAAGGGYVVRPKVMSDFQASLEGAAMQAARPCFEEGTALFFREVPFGNFEGDTRAAVSDGEDCYQFGWMGGEDRWRVSGQLQECEPFTSTAR